MTSISDNLRAIAKADEVPREALTALVERFDEAAPPLREILDKAARGRPLSDEDASLFFYGLHVLAAGRDRQSFPALLRLLRRPAEEVEDLLGDALTESLRRIVAGLFDDDAEELFAAAADMRIDASARDSLISAAAFLTWDGRIPRERLRKFLVSLEEETPPPADDFAWLGWTMAVTLLGFLDLTPNLKRVFAATLQPENIMEWRHIEQDFRDAERAPSDIERFASAGLGYPDDILDTLAWTERSYPDELPEQPIINPNRNVGRNDPCPCGSGKKYKKCCLANG